MSGRTLPPVLLLLGLATFLATPPVFSQTKLLRFPDLAGDRVVFTYAGDLWLAPASGGTAWRLTAHPGLELFPKFSPDGQWVAFTGQYDGDEQVYVIPTAGGTPKLLTYYPAAGPLPPRWGYDNQVYGFTPDGESVVFRSLRDAFDLTDSRLFTVAIDGGMPEPLPMPYSGAGDLSPDGRQIVYSPLVRDFRHWKRYQGGWAQDLYIFDLESHAARQITDNPRSDRDPMWIGDKIYFASDRSGTLNLYAFDPASSATDQLTDSTLWDVRWPSADHAGRRIVYELDGELMIYELATAASTPIQIRVPDDGVAMRPSHETVDDLIEDFGLSPKGKRAVFAARGDIFTAPVEHGATRNLTRSSSAHDREPVWSPDGSRIAFVSDADGEEEIYVIDQEGREAPLQLTDGSQGQYFDLVWSPDSKRLAFQDQGARLYVLDVARREKVEIADDPENFGLTFSWSPDSRYLAFSLANPSTFRSLYVWSVGDRKLHQVTSDRFNAYGPTWDPEGRYLYYLSDREYAPQIGSWEFNYLLNRETQIYALALNRDVPHPFPPRSDEVTDEEEDEDDGEDEAEPEAKEKRKAEKEDEEEDETDDDESPEPIEIDFEGLGDRVARVPVAADNYAGLWAVEGHLIFLRGDAFYYDRDPAGKPELRIFDLEEREETSLAMEVDDARLSPDGSKILLEQGSSYQRIDASPGGGASGKPIATGGLQVDRVPAEEWAQIFDEVWRRFRDYFYVANMHGYDWQALRQRYEPLLAHVAHRSDLNYVLSEMIAELNASHTYVTGGDFNLPERPNPGLLGARFELDDDAGRYRFAEIFAGDNAEERYRSPLTEVGVEVTAGDYLLAVNGAELTADSNPFRLLRHAGGGPVELLVGETPDLAQARKVTVDPVRSEDSLLYLAWTERNRRWVDEQSSGRVGYIHIPDMGGDGLREFIKGFYSQIRKEGRVIDVRSNGGGNVSQMLIERLAREVLMVDFERNVDHPQTYPNFVFHGHLVCLLDEDTASDGDQFAYVFRRAGLGPLVGKRSWGGVVGIYGRGQLIDGGGVSVPEAGSADPEGDWVVEGYGVDPDVVVENDPQEVLKGRDQQLEKGLELVLEKIQQEPRRLPDAPAPPVKTE